MSVLNVLASLDSKRPACPDCVVVPQGVHHYRHADGCPTGDAVNEVMAADMVRLEGMVDGSVVERVLRPAEVTELVSAGVLRANQAAKWRVRVQRLIVDGLPVLRLVYVKGSRAKFESSWVDPGELDDRAAAELGRDGGGPA